MPNGIKSCHDLTAFHYLPFPLPSHPYHQLITEKGNLNFYPTIIMQILNTSLFPKIYVYPVNRINFPNQLIQFCVKIFNPPGMSPVNTNSLHVQAQSPSGIPAVCSNIVQKERDSTGSFQVFQGFVRSSNEVGPYQLIVRVVRPPHYVDGSSHVSEAVAPVRVSSNYLLKSHQRNSHWVYQLPVHQKENPSIINIWGLACDRSTNLLYYTEGETRRVGCMDPIGGNILFHFQTPNPYGFRRPVGIACDEINRRVLIADMETHMVFSFLMDGEFIGFFGGKGSTNGYFNRPVDVAASPLGTHIAVTDSGNRRIQLFDHYGNFINKFSLFENNPFMYSPDFDYPHGIAFGSKGQTIYATDFFSNNILKIPLDMKYCSRILSSGKLHKPMGLVVDEAGTLLVTDSGHGCIHHVDETGKIISTIRSVGGMQLKYPTNITMMSGGIIALLDVDSKVYFF